jgi:hypothetical protein
VYPTDGIKYFSSSSSSAGAFLSPGRFRKYSFRTITMQILNGDKLSKFLLGGSGRKKLVSGSFAVIISATFFTQTKLALVLFTAQLKKNVDENFFC